MMQHIINAKRSLVALAGVVVLSGLAHAADIEQSYEVSKGGTLELKTDVGSLDIQTHNKDVVAIEVDIQGDDAEDFKVFHQSAGGDVTIEGTFDRGDNYWGRNMRVKFSITVPKDYNLNIRTAGGAIEIDDLNGNIDAHTSGGSIQIADVNGEVELHTSGGSITTGSVNGDLNAHTSGGSINATFAKQLTDDVKLDTSGGSITVRMIEDMKVDLDAKTSGGRVRTDFNVNGRISKKSIRGEINGGGPRLKLHTSGGSISIKEY